jgi:hypothetical protein
MVASIEMCDQREMMMVVGLFYRRRSKVDEGTMKRTGEGPAIVLVAESSSRLLSDFCCDRKWICYKAVIAAKWRSIRPRFRGGRACSCRLLIAWL